MRHLANDADTTSGRLAAAPPSERLRNAVELHSSSNVRGDSGEAFGAEQRAPQARAELRPDDGYLQLVHY